MKKFLFFMLAAALFCGCDKDDVPCPVTGISIPASSAENPVQPGTSVTIRGAGFTEDSEIWLRGMARTDTQATVSNVTATAITFIAPAVSGEQAVILKQDGGTYELGRLFFAEEPEPEDLELLPKKVARTRTTYYDKSMIYETTYQYGADGNVIGMLENEMQDETVYGTNDYRSTADGISMTWKSDVDPDYTDIRTYRITDERVSSYTQTYKDAAKEYRSETIADVSYDTKGYVNEIVFVEKYTNAESSETNHGRWDIEVSGGTLIRGTWAIDYGWEYTMNVTPGQVNNLNIDLWGLILSLYDDEVSFMPMTMNYGGKRFQKLPEQIIISWKDGDETGTDKYEIEYEMNGEYISKVIVKCPEDEVDEYNKGLYATVEVFYEE
ncbi:IPT/TIG domain-containing protein [uncultured Alistipes sp.]|uniref:IPT/TIG domain-containing protein n=3 Tax=uncultured Alistipes sp. TaxID=538949 RepID=UPI0026700B56|nr:IPT/TIG domain-containing protein [uncultured Alistipes sp.]